MEDQMAEKELFHSIVAQGTEPTSRLTGLTPEDKLQYLLDNHPEFAAIIADNQRGLLHILGKTILDWNAPSDSFREGD